MREVEHYRELAIAPTTADNLHLKELVVIRWTSLMAEAMAWATAHGSLEGAPAQHEIIIMIHQLTDRAEHVAQYALEDLSLEMRAQFLQKNVETLLFVLDKNADWLTTTPSYLPSRDIMRAWVL